jgi:DNA-binding MarR family transcriptional regulator
MGNARVVADDVRFMNEAAFIHALGGRRRGSSGSPLPALRATSPACGGGQGWGPHLRTDRRRAERDGLSPYQLQSAMLIPQYNISRLIDRMARAGHVERLSCDADGRGQIVRMTPEGKALQRKMWPVYPSFLEREFASRLSEAEAKRLAELLHGQPGPLVQPPPRAPARRGVRNRWSVGSDSLVLGRD